MDMGQPRYTLKSLETRKLSQQAVFTHTRNDEMTSSCRLAPVRLTGGLTNHAVSQLSSSHLAFTYSCTFSPAFLTNSSSSSVPFSDTIMLSSVTPHSDNAGRHWGRKEGEGGGGALPVKPHNPSWSMRGLTFTSTRSGWKMGTLVQIRVCSTSAGTDSWHEYVVYCC